MTESYDPGVCVICGEPWEPPVKNLCACGGFCSWGRYKGAEPDSWVKAKDDNGNEGYVPRSPNG